MSLKSPPAVPVDVRFPCLKLTFWTTSTWHSSQLKLNERVMSCSRSVMVYKYHESLDSIWLLHHCERPNKSLAHSECSINTVWVNEYYSGTSSPHFPYHPLFLSIEKLLETWLLILTLPLTDYVTLGKLLFLAGLLSSHLKKRREILDSLLSLGKKKKGMALWSWDTNGIFLRIQALQLLNGTYVSLRMFSFAWLTQTAKSLLGTHCLPLSSLLRKFLLIGLRKDLQTALLSYTSYKLLMRMH